MIYNDLVKITPSVDIEFGRPKVETDTKNAVKITPSVDIEFGPNIQNNVFIRLSKSPLQ